MWLLNKIIEGVVGFFQTVFAYVLDLVVGLAALPFIGPILILLNIVLSVICGVADVIANGVLSALTYDQFGQETLFEIIFHPDNFYLILRTFSIGLVMAIFLFQIIRTMVTPPDDVSDDPLGLVGRTFISAILVFASRGLIRYAFQGFGTLYRVIGGGANFKVDFAEFSDTAKDLMRDDLPSLGIRAQIVTLITLIFLIVMCWALAKRVIAYVIELVQRFTIVGVMLVTCPLAATLYVSKSTRNSFRSWIRMIGSQLTLLVFGIFFMRIFCSAFDRFSTAFHLIKNDFSVNRVTTLLVWTFMTYAILSVGMRVDSMLKTIGLSAAECGADMSMTILSEVSNLATAVSYATAYGVGVASGEIEPGPIMRGASTIAGGVAQAGNNLMRGIRRNRGEPETNTPTTVDEINRAVPSVATSGGFASGGTIVSGSFKLNKEAGNNIRQNMRGLPSRMKERLDPTAFSIENGSLRGSTFANKKGERTSVIFIPTDSPRNRQSHDNPTDKNAPGPRTILADRDELQDKHPGGREVMIGGQSYQMYAIGSEATALMTSSPQVRRAMRELAEKTGDEVFEVKNANGDATGIWEQMHYNTDGTLTKRFWAPTTRYRVDDAVGAVHVTVGDMLFAQYDINYGMNPMGGGEVPAPKAFETWGEASRQEWFKKAFPVYKGQDVQHVRYENGVYAADINGKHTLTFSPTDYGLKQGVVESSNIRSVTTALGSQYVSVAYSTPDENHPEGILNAEWVSGDASVQPEHAMGQSTPSRQAASGPSVSTGSSAGGPMPTPSAPDGGEPFAVPNASRAGSEDTAGGQASGAGMPHHESGGVEAGQSGKRTGEQNEQKPPEGGLSAFERHLLFSRAPEELIPTTLDMDVTGPYRDEDVDGHDTDDESDDKDGTPRRKRMRTAREAVAEEEGKVNLSPIIQDAIRRRRKK